MDSKVLRSIKDIQFRAEALINGKPTLGEIEEFNQYNEELKKYLLDHLKESELVERVMKIPRILEESEGEVATRNILATVLMMFASPLVNYFQDRQRIANALEYIQEARGKYASIEFLAKSYR